jgi:diacylglycerol kinase family enzyme
MCPVKTAMPGDGALDVVFTRSPGSLRTLGLVPSYLAGRSGRHPREFMFRRGRNIEIRSDAPLIVNYDDIVSFDTSLSVELLPGALKFVDAGKQGYRGALHERDAR